MKQLFTKRIFAATAAVLAAAGSLSAQAFTENFDDITLLTGNGWSLQNLSTPVGSTNWFQGTNVAAGGPFDSYNGAANAYIGANYNNTGNTGTISNWLITPNRTLRNGDVFTFYSRKVAPDSYADRLEVRLSTNGASTNAGTNATTVGDFTTLVMSINPNLILGVYPTVWTQYTITISGLPAPTSGRLAFRYFVTGAGLNGTNSDYIGIDNVVYTPYVCPTFTIGPGFFPNGTAGTAYSQSMTQTGALGAPTYTVTAGALPPGLTLGAASGTISGTPTATGTFNFTVTVSDNSGCAGAVAYSITINCPTNGASMSSIPPLCDNGSLYILTEGSPAGGSYSGANVSGGMFDPAGGTQTITYTLIDAYGCTQVATGTATVNTAPTVTLSSFAAVCDNAGMQTLTGGSPAGGVFSGTNVSGGMFDPSGGTQTIDYTYTDANGCSDMASQTLTVNAAPTVTLQAPAAVCDNAGMITLTGESPAGGTWSGTGVTGNMFDPSSGTQTITYTYTDANGCTNSASEVQTVNAAPTVTVSALTPVCSNSGTVTLTGESPAGGTWSGTGVSGNTFDPSVGTQTISYTYTDANGCTGSTQQTQVVNNPPTIQISAMMDSACLNTPPIALFGSPMGGTFSGPGTSPNTFTPSAAGAGVHTISYTYTDTNGCSDTRNMLISVFGNPTVTASAAPTVVCAADANVALTGAPAGGSFTGPSVSGNSFDPSIGAGNYNIVYTYTDANGCSGSDTTAVQVNACVGIEETNAASFTMFPNPATDNVTVSLHEGNSIVRVLNMDGQLIQSVKVNGNTTTIELGGLATGVYVVEVEHDGVTSHQRLIIQ